MINPHVDELSMMTYLSHFPEAELQEGAHALIHLKNNFSNDASY